MGNTAHIEINSANAPARAYKVFIAEDSPLMQPRIAQLAMQVKDVVICGMADNCADVLTIINATRPDAAIFDINLRDGSSLPSLKLAKLAVPEMLAVVCSNFATSDYRDAARAAGASQFIDKSLECDRIPEILAQFQEISARTRTQQLLTEEARP